MGGAGGTGGTGGGTGGPGGGDGSGGGPIIITKALPPWIEARYVLRTGIRLAFERWLAVAGHIRLRRETSLPRDTVTQMPDP
jgi:hypothetical protein